MAKSTSKKVATENEGTDDILEIELEDIINEDELNDDEILDEEEITEVVDDFYGDIKSLPGVGPATRKKLIEGGFTSLKSIAFSSPRLIQEESGLGEKTVAKLVKAAMEILHIGFKSADAIWEKRKKIVRITTGSQELDDALNGGIETGSLTEFYGEYRTGKTQIMHQLCVNIQLPKSEGGLNAKALYIDTEGTFRPERIISMAEGLDLDYKKVLKNIVYARAYNSDHQMMLAKDASRLAVEENIKLIVVDSLIGHFRSEYIGRGTLAERQQILNSHLHDLLRLSELHELAVCVTNQVQSDPGVFYGNPTRATGGNIVAHGSTIRIYLRKGKGDQRVAKIVDAPHLPEAEAIFLITEEGIKGL